MLEDRRRIRKVTDDQILTAAAAVFAEHGYSGASMLAIATRADTTKATIYANCGDKSQLYAATLSREAEELQSTLLSAYSSASGESPWEQVHAGARAIFTFAADRPDGFRLLLAGSDVDAPGQFLTETYDQVHRAITAMLTPYFSGAGVTNSHGAEFVAAVLIAICRSAATTALLDSRMDPDAAAAAAAAMAIAALRGLDVQLLNAL